MNRGWRTWLLAALVGTAAAAATAQDIVIAQVGPLSGPLGLNGESNYIGAKACFDAINAQGGIGGRKIRFVREDDTYKPAETVRLVRLVAERDKPLAFVNLLGTASVGALLKERVLERVAIPAVGATPGAESLREPGSPYLYHVSAGDRVQLRTMLSHLSTIGVRQIGVAYQDLPFGKNGLEYIEQQAPALGLTITAKALVPAGADDTRAAAAELQKSGAQTYLMVLAPNSGAAFVRDARKAQDRTPIYGMSYVTAQGVVKAAGLEQAVGVALAQVTPNAAVPSNGLTREFHRAMKAHAPEAPLSSMTMTGYLAARVTAEAIRRANAASPAAVQHELARLRTDLNGYPVDFTGGNNVGSRMVDIAVIDRNGHLLY